MVDYLGAAKWYVASAEALRTQTAEHWRRRRERYLGIAGLLYLVALARPEVCEQCHGSGRVPTLVGWPASADLGTCPECRPIYVKGEGVCHSVDGWRIPKWRDRP